MGTLRHYRHRTLGERLKTYSEVMELRATGKTVKEIAESLGISRRDVSYWFRVNKPSRTVYAPDLTPRLELAYLVGAYLGDGRTAGEQDKKVRFNLADPAFAETLNNLVAKVIGAQMKSVALEEGFYSVSYDCAALYDFLQQPLERQMSVIDSFPTMFLRGFFDAEGYASPRLDHVDKEFQGVTVGAVNTNPDYLGKAQAILASLGIRSRFKTTHLAGEPMKIRGKTFVRKYDVRHLVITRANDVQQFNTMVGFAIPRKREKLEDMAEILDSMTRWEGYDWFVGHYELRDGRWIKKTNQKSKIFSGK